MAELVLRCLDRAPDRRFASVEVLSHELVSSLPGPADHGPGPLAPRGTPGPRLSATRVAIVPFCNLGPREDDFLVDELTNELIDGLSMLGTLRVRPRRSVQSMDTTDLPALGKALDVDVLVEGTLLRSSESVRISARVLAVADSRQVWGRRFDREAGDLVVVTRGDSAIVVIVQCGTLPCFFCSSLVVRSGLMSCQ